MEPRPRPGRSPLSARKIFEFKFGLFMCFSCAFLVLPYCIDSFCAKKILIQIWAIYVLFLCVFSATLLYRLFLRAKILNTDTLKNHKKRTINLICLYICLDISLLLIG